VHAAIDKVDGVSFRCTRDGAEAERWLVVPAWMFDRAACAQGAALTAAPFVRLDALIALSALLDQVLRIGAASSNAPLSGADRTSRDQNRGEAYDRQDGQAGADAPAQPGSSASDGSVRERARRNVGSARRHGGSCRGGRRMR
jgi:hypothetical protein